MTLTVDGVTKRYELTRTREVIRDIISNNITDPLTGTEARAEKSDWILDGFPTKDGKLGVPAPEGWKYPIIVISYSNITDENKVLDASKDMITHSISIAVHDRKTKKRISGRELVNQLSEEIRYILKVTAKNDLNFTATLHGPDVIGSTNDTDFIGGNKYYTKTVEYEFTRFD